MFEVPRGKFTRPERKAATPQGDDSRFRMQMWAISVGVVATSVALASIMPEPSHSTSTLDVPTQHVSSLDIFRPILAATHPVQLRAVSNEPQLSIPSSGATRSIFSTMANLPIDGRQVAKRTDWGIELRELIQEPLVAPLLQLASPVMSNGATNGSDVRLTYRAGSIQRSLLEDGRDAGLSDSLILKLAEIFGWDIDFALDLRDGDRFLVVYEEKLWLGRKISDGDILAAEFINRGRVYRAIGFRDGQGKISYFTPMGKSLQRPFLRTPVQFSSVSSSFSKARFHPILKTWRAHTGIDYAAPAGTPVRATASGKVVSVGWNGGYGNAVVIDHGNSYNTLYAHLSDYRSGLRAGRLIQQGEIVGYVGSTGLATGPHLHYEFQVHGQHQNPLTFRFPDGDTVPTISREEFLRTARLWKTRLDLLGDRQLAAR